MLKSTKPLPIIFKLVQETGRRTTVIKENSR